MSWYIFLSICTLSCVPRYLSYGVDYAKGQSRLSTGVVALSQMEWFSRLCFGCLRFVCFWLGFAWACVFGLFVFCLACVVCSFLTNAFRIIACNTRVLYGFELVRLPFHFLSSLLF